MSAKFHDIIDDSNKNRYSVREVGFGLLWHWPTLSAVPVVVCVIGSAQECQHIISPKVECDVERITLLCALLLLRLLLLLLLLLSLRV